MMTIILYISYSSWFKKIIFIKNIFSFIKNSLTLFFNPTKKDKIFQNKEIDINFIFDDTIKSKYHIINL